MRWRDRGALLAGCALIATLGACGSAGSPAAAVRPTPVQTPAPSPSINPTLREAQAIVAPAAAPARLLVPSIKVDAPVESVGLDSQGRMGTPAQASDVAWYKLGSAPGDVGDAVIAGHLDWTSGPAVFWYLGKMHAGDRITVVRADGSKVDFLTDSTRTVPYDSSTDSLFTKDGPPSLTLITCAGAWDRAQGTYLQRLVVHATLAPPVSTDAPGDEGG